MILTRINKQSNNDCWDCTSLIKKTNMETTQYTQVLLSSMLIRLNDTKLPLQLVSYNKHSQPT